MTRNPLRRFLDKTISGDATNLVAEGVVIDGFIKGIGHLIVAGRIKGDCKLAGTITLSDTGRWQGKIEAERILIAGELHGSAHAGEKLEIAATARIEGDVSAPMIAVAKGAVVDGEMHVTGSEGPRTFEEKRADRSDAQATVSD